MKKELYTIEYCEIRKVWIVFKRLSPSAMQEVYKNKYKKECKKWLDENTK